MPKAELGNAQKHAWGALLLAHSAATRAIDQGLRQAGQMTLEAYDVLLALEDSPDQRARMCDLADAVVFQASSVTRLVDRLESAGWVSRERCGSDRRVVYACLTPAGLTARQAAWPTYRGLIQAHFGQYLDEAQASAMVDALRGVVPRSARWPETTTAPDPPPRSRRSTEP